MKITRIDQFRPRRRCRLVRIATDTGIEGWGETTLENVLHLCPSHHTLVHEGGFRVTREGDDLVFRTPEGRVLDPAPSPPGLGGDPIADLCAAQQALDLDYDTGLTYWDGRTPDYSACVAAAQASLE